MITITSVAIHAQQIIWARNESEERKGKRKLEMNWVNRDLV
jgi:hypothetical protein